MEIFTDPVSGCQYVVDPASGESRWLEEMLPPSPYDISPDAGGRDAYEISPDVAPQVARRPDDGRTRRALRERARSERSRSERSLGSRRGVRIAVGFVGVSAVLIAVGSFLPDRDTTATLADLGTAVSTPSPRPNLSSAAPGEVPPGKAVPGKTAAVAVPGKTAAVAVPVRDGSFEFTVTGVRVAPTIGNEYVSQRAQGQYLLVSLTVKNVSSESQLFMAAVQKLYDTAGQEYEADSGASIYLGKEGENYIEQLPAGITVKTVAVFDIPVGVTVDRIELHEIPGTAGVDVRLIG
ncbi:MAG: hypothetical protein QG622_2956 [Actinomycetota bacterium]|nr:hypothetical protein [Actinomycetota bacterium]